MSRSLATRLVGTRDDRIPVVAVTALTALVSFVLYAAEIVGPTGGLVWIPFAAVVIGLVVAAGAAVGDLPPVVGPAVGSAAVFGFRADWGLLGLSSRSLAERVGYVVELDGLAYVVVVGTLAGGVGYLLGRGVVVLRDAVTGYGDAST